MAGVSAQRFTELLYIRKGSHFLSSLTSRHLYVHSIYRQQQSSWNLLIHSIADLRGLEEIIRNSLRKLVSLRPFADLLKVATLVLSVEVDEGLRVIGVDPNLTQDSHVHGAHQLLADDIETVSYPR